MARGQPLSNWDRRCKYVLSTVDMGELLGVSDGEIRNNYVDQDGRPVKWSEVDHDTTEVFLDWAGLRVRARRNRNGDAMFLTAEAEAVFAPAGRQLHPSANR